MRLAITLDQLSCVWRVEATEKEDADVGRGRRVPFPPLHRLRSIRPSTVQKLVAGLAKASSHVALKQAD